MNVSALRNDKRCVCLCILFCSGNINVGEEIVKEMVKGSPSPQNLDG